MKKTAFIFTLAATLCTFTSCYDEVESDDIYQAPVIVIETTAAKEKDITTTAAAVTQSADVRPMNAVVTTETVQNEAAVTTEPKQNAAEQAADEEIDPAAGTAFKNGIANGNIYTSEYAEFRFVAPEGREFLDASGLYTEYRMPLRFKSPEDKAFYLTGIKDASVTYENAEGSMFIWFYNVKLRYPETPGMTVEDFIQKEFMDQSSDVKKTIISGPETVNICGSEYTKITWSSFDYPHSTYFRKIDDDFIITVNAMGTAVDDLESRFEPVV